MFFPHASVFSRLYTLCSSASHSSLFHRVESPIMVKKLKELSNDDIDRCFAGDSDYGGCFSKDRLPKSLGSKFYVVNMQDEEKGNGTHWTMVYDCKPSEVIYMDSMGEVPPQSVKKLMNKTRKKQLINRFQLQPMGSSSCGWWCIAVAKALEKGVPMEDFILHFDMHDPEKNDKTLAALF